MNIVFLSSQQASHEYIATDYFDQMNSAEIGYRLKVGGWGNLGSPISATSLRKLYGSLTRDFTTYEQAVVNFYFKQLYDILSQKAPGLIPKAKPIGLIKLEQGVDWDYPYTINHCVVIPVKFLNSLIKTYQRFGQQLNQPIQQMWNPVRPPYQMINQKLMFLFHELIHILQKNKNLYSGHKTLFDYIYTEVWGFHKISKDQIVNRDKFLNVITNPDGYNFEWAIPIFNHETNYQHWFLPLLSLDLNNRPTGILVELEKLPNGHFKALRRWNFIHNYKRYVNKFYGLEQQLYHPNEIMAHLLSNYVILEVQFTSTTDTFDYFKFYRFLDKYFISSNFTPFRNK